MSFRSLAVVGRQAAFGGGAKELIKRANFVDFVFFGPLIRLGARNRLSF